MLLRIFMMKLFASFLALACLGASTLCAQQISALTLKQTIALPVVTGKFDHFALDDAGQRLFASSTGTGAVIVIDLTSNKIVESLQGLGKPHGLAWIAETGRLFVTDGAKGELDVYSGAPLKRIQSIPLAEDADDMVYDSATKLLYVGYGGTNAANPSRIAVVDTASLHVVTNLPVASHPEALELDPNADRIFANIADSGQVVVIDGKTQRIAATWPLQQGKGNTPLAFDAADDLLLVGCRTPAELVVINATTGTEGSTVSSDTGADDLFFDPASHHAYLITGAGTVDSFELSADRKLVRLATTQTDRGAKTGYLDIKHRRLYIGVPGTAGSSSVRVYETSLNKD
jgi:DNA-binding beta-propeller fold protein YncE